MKKIFITLILSACVFTYGLTNQCSGEVTMQNGNKIKTECVFGYVMVRDGGFFTTNVPRQIIGTTCVCRKNDILISSGDDQNKTEYVVPLYR